MAAKANVTITADIGPDIQNTSKVYQGVTRINVDLAGETVELTLSDGRIVCFDFDSIATIAWTVSSNLHTVSFT